MSNLSKLKKSEERYETLCDDMRIICNEVVSQSLREYEQELFAEYREVLRKVRSESRTKEDVARLYELMKTLDKDIARVGKDSDALETLQFKDRVNSIIGELADTLQTLEFFAPRTLTKDNLAKQMAEQRAWNDLQEWLKKMRVACAEASHVAKAHLRM